MSNEWIPRNNNICQIWIKVNKNLEVFLSRITHYQKTFFFLFFFVLWLVQRYLYLQPLWNPNYFIFFLNSGNLRVNWTSRTRSCWLDTPSPHHRYENPGPALALPKLNFQNQHVGMTWRNKYKISVMPVTSCLVAMPGLYVSLVTRKPAFGGCDQVRLKPACSATVAS